MSVVAVRKVTETPAVCRRGKKKVEYFIKNIQHGRFLLSVVILILPPVSEILAGVF